MKKLLSILSVFILAIALVGCNSDSVKSVSPSEVQKKVGAKDSFIVVVTSTTCSYCKEYKPVVKDFASKMKDVDLVEVISDKIDDNQEKTDFLQKYAITGTPTTLFFKDGELATMVGEVISEQKLEDLYNEYVK